MFTPIPLGPSGRFSPILPPPIVFARGRPAPTATCAAAPPPSPAGSAQPPSCPPPPLRGRLDAHERTLAALQAAKQAVLSRPLLASRPESQHSAASAARTLTAEVGRAAQVRRELKRIAHTLRTYQQASRNAQGALETAILGMGKRTVKTALRLLPPRVAHPVEVAAQVIARGIDRGLDLVLGR